MKILTRLIIPLLLFSCSGVTIIAKQKSTKQEKKKSTTTKNKNGRAVPSVCPPCPNFPCTGATAPSGCTGPGCTGACIPGTIANFCCLNVSTTINVAGQANIAQKNVLGNASIGGILDVKDDLIVQEDADLKGNVCMEDDLDVGNDLSVGGAGVVLGDLNIGAGANFTGPVTINNNVNALSLIVTGSQQVTGALSVDGDTKFNGLLVASGGLSVFNGQVINDGGLTILCSGATGGSGCTGAVINGDVCITGDEIINGDLNVRGILTVDELATFNGDVTIGTSGPTGSNTTLITNSTVNMNTGLTIASGDQIINAGALTIATGTLTVGGASTFKQQIITNNGVLIQDGLTVNGGQNINLGDLDVTSGSAFISGGLTVNGSITSENGQSSFASLTLTSTQNSECPTGPAALVVQGGAGVAKDLWMGGSIYFANVVSEDGVPTAFDYYEEICFATSFIWGGQPVTPATSVLIKAVRVGNLVNLLIPAFIINNPGAHIDVIRSASALPARFRPFTTIRGAASTLISNFPNTPTENIVIGQLAEFDISPAGIITFGIPGLNDALGPQRVTSVDYVAQDYNTITYMLDGCSNRCKMPCQ